MDDIERKKQEYGCNGHCYGCYLDLPKDDPRREEICPLVETCPETRIKEFWATIITGFILLTWPLWIILTIAFLVGGI